MIKFYYLLISSILVLYARAQLPTVCVGNATVENSGICCPKSQENGQICGGPSRGHCATMDVYRYTNSVPIASYLDDRIDWPLRFLTKACKCNKKFYGIACEECWFGWEGPNCDRRITKIRRDIRGFSKEEKNIFVNILVESQTYPSGFSVLVEDTANRSDPVRNPRWEAASIQYYLVALHRYSSRSTFYRTESQCKIFNHIMNTNHGGLGFITFHRFFVMVWEKLLSRIAKEKYDIHDFALPFWDWINRKECYVCTNDLLGAPGEFTIYGQRLSKGSAFYNWPEYCGEPLNRTTSCVGCHSRKNFGPLVREWRNYGYPTKKDLEYVLSHADYYRPDEVETLSKCDVFHFSMEGDCERPGGKSNHGNMHNRMHNLVKGSFCCASTAVNDPLFSVHHPQVDRILQMWIEIHKPNQTALPTNPRDVGQCRNCTIVGFFPIITHKDVFIDSRELGYYFEHMEFGENYPPENH